MKKTTVLTLLLTVGWCLCVSTPNARAQDTARDDSRFYIQAGAVQLTVQTQHYSPFWNRDPPPPWNNPKERRDSLLSSHFTTPALEVVLGKELGKDWFIEARGQFASHDQSLSETIRPVAAFSEVGFFGIDGSWGSAGSIFPADVTLDFAWHQVQLELLCGRASSMETFSITPLAGLWTMHSNQTYRLDYDLPAGTAHWSLRDKLTTTYGGLMVGARLNHALGKADLSLEATFGAGVAYTEYGATQNSSNNTNLTQTEYKTTPAGMAAIRAGLDLPLTQGLSVGLDAGAQYLSYVPGVAASNLSPQEVGEPSHIVRGEALNTSLGMNFKYRF